MEQSQEDKVYTDRQVAEILFKDKLKPTSWKTVQRMARNGEIRGKRVGRWWRFHQDSIRDYLLRRK